jgi:hypothetical protein
MNNAPAAPRRVGVLLLDDGLAWILAALAAAGSFTHIRDLALRSGQHGWMANAIAVCIDMMCVMAVRERKRDQRLRRRCGRLSWPMWALMGFPHQRLTDFLQRTANDERRNERGTDRIDRLAG